MTTDDLAERLDGAPNPFIPWLASIHKSLDWSHERDWRIVAAIGDDSPGLEWKMPMPSRLLLGHRMEPEWRRKVLEVARANGIAAFEVGPSRMDHFDLDVKPASPT